MKSLKFRLTTAIEEHMRLCFSTDVVYSAQWSYDDNGEMNALTVGLNSEELCRLRISLMQAEKEGKEEAFEKSDSVQAVLNCIPIMGERRVSDILHFLCLIEMEYIPSIINTWKANNRPETAPDPEPEVPSQPIWGHNYTKLDGKRMTYEPWPAGKAGRVYNPHWLEDFGDVIRTSGTAPVVLELLKEGKPEGEDWVIDMNLGLAIYGDYIRYQDWKDEE